MSLSPRTAVIFSVMTIVLGACDKQEPAIAPSAPMTTSTSVPANAEQLEAESSLSTKRGIVTLAGERQMFRACGTSQDFVLKDQTDGLLIRVYGELGGKPLYVESFGDRDESGEFVLEELLYAATTNPTTACQAPRARYELLAHGVNPSWSVEVTQDAMVLKQTSAPTEITFGTVDTSDTEGTVTYRAGIDKHVLELIVTQQACGAAERGEYFGYTATAKFDKQVFSGCARLGE